METIFNWFTSKIAYVINSIMIILPDSPFVMLQADAEIQQFLGWLNWFLPVGEAIAIMEAWLVAITIFYAVQLILRWAKAIE